MTSRTRFNFKPRTGRPPKSRPFSAPYRSPRTPAQAPAQTTPRIVVDDQDTESIASRSVIVNRDGNSENPGSTTTIIHVHCSDCDSKKSPGPRSGCGNNRGTCGTGGSCNGYNLWQPSFLPNTCYPGPPNWMVQPVQVGCPVWDSLGYPYMPGGYGGCGGIPYALTPGVPLVSSLGFPPNPSPLTASPVIALPNGAPTCW